jgi:hypothetical protein
MELVCKTLKSFDIETQIAMLNKSIVNGWTDVYALKETNQQQPTKPAGRISFMDLV